MDASELDVAAGVPIVYLTRQPYIRDSRHGLVIRDDALRDTAKRLPDLREVIQE